MCWGMCSVWDTVMGIWDRLVYRVIIGGIEYLLARHE